MYTKPIYQTSIPTQNINLNRNKPKYVTGILDSNTNFYIQLIKLESPTVVESDDSEIESSTVVEPDDSKSDLKGEILSEEIHWKEKSSVGERCWISKPTDSIKRGYRAQNYVFPIFSLRQKGVLEQEWVDQY